MIPAAWSLAAKGVLLAAVAAGGFVGGAKWVQARWNADKLERAELAAEAERMARAADQRRAAGAQEALDGYARNVRRSAADAAAARGELDRLRDALAAANAASDPDTSARVDAAARAVAGECPAALEALARTCRSREDELTGLQEWVRAQARSD